ncbi:MAG TPA: hypothetical protein VF319_05900 [Caldimonas sp.]
MLDTLAGDVRGHLTLASSLLADLHRWRETFAEKLRGWGVEAEATRQPTRGNRSFDPLWRIRARGRTTAHQPHE